MLIGQTIAAEQHGDPVVANDTVVYTPWFPRQGDGLTSTVEIISIINAELTVAVETKNSEETDSQAAAPSSTTNIVESTAKTASARSTGLDELVRYKLTLTCTATSADTGVCHFRILAPAWETNGA